MGFRDEHSKERGKHPSFAEVVEEATRHLEPRNQFRHLVRGVGKLKRGEHESFKEFHLRVDQKRAEVVGHGVNAEAALRAMAWSCLRTGIDAGLHDEALDLFVDVPDLTPFLVMLSGAHQRAAGKKGMASLAPAAGPQANARAQAGEPEPAKKQQGRTEVNNIEVSEVIVDAGLAGLERVIPAIPPLKKSFILGDETLVVSDAVTWELDSGAGMNVMRADYVEELVAKGAAIQDSGPIYRTRKIRRFRNRRVAQRLPPRVC